MVITRNTLRELNIPREFGPYDTETGMKPSPVMDEVFQQLDPTITTRWGATAFVLIDPDPSVREVYKIPFNGFFDEAGDFHPFVKCKDYLSRASDIYYKAWDEDVGKMLLDTSQMSFATGNPVHDTPIYMQPKMGYFEGDKDLPPEVDCYTDKDVKTLNSFDRFNNYWYQFSNRWLLNAIHIFGIKAVAKLMEILQSYQVFDLHSDNYGYYYNHYRKYFEPVISDYAGMIEDERR